MREYLIWWKNLELSEKERIKSEQVTKTISFDFIKEKYKEIVNA